MDDYDKEKAYQAYQEFHRYREEAVILRNKYQKEGKSWKEIHQIMYLAYYYTLLGYGIDLNRIDMLELSNDNNFRAFIDEILYNRISDNDEIYKLLANILSKFSQNTGRIYNKNFFDKMRLILLDNAKTFRVYSIDIKFLFYSAQKYAPNEDCRVKRDLNGRVIWDWNGKVEWDWTGISNHPSLTEEYVRKYINNKYYKNGKFVTIWDFNVLLKKCTLDKELTVQQLDGTSQKVHVASYFPIECLEEIIKTPVHKQIYFANRHEEEIKKGTPCGDLPDTICLLLKKK